MLSGKVALPELGMKERKLFDGTRWQICNVVTKLQFSLRGIERYVRYSILSRYCFAKLFFETDGGLEAGVDSTAYRWPVTGDV